MRIIFYTLLLIPATSFTQIEIFNQSLTDSTLPILYSGVENNITIQNRSSTKSEYVLTASKGTISKIEKNKFQLFINTSDEPILLTVFLKEKDVFSKTYTSKRLPKMKCGIGPIKDSIASKNEILANRFIRTYLPDCNYKLKFLITSFTAIFIKYGDSTSTTSRGNYFSKEQIELTENLSTGDKIYVDDIYGFGPNGRSQKLPPFTIYIK